MTDRIERAADARSHQERLDVAIALLLVQSALGLLSLLGMLTLGALMPLFTPAGLLVTAGFVAPLFASVGLARGWRWARRLTVGWQVLTLLSVATNVLLNALPQVQMELTLSGILTGAGLPIALIALLRVPLPVEASAARPARGTSVVEAAVTAPAGRRSPLGA